MKSVRGNLVTMSQGGMFDVVVHGCNCFNTMSKGLAESIMNEWPQVFVEDNNTRSGDRQKQEPILMLRVNLTTKHL
jgi:O-acetyl-ADP-ribose deacetylase (regulator of RNase III)